MTPIIVKYKGFECELVGVKNADTTNTMYLLRYNGRPDTWVNWDECEVIK